MLAEKLNGDCHSATIDRAALDAALRLQGEDFFRHVTEYCPHLFAAVPFFMSTAQVEQMHTVIAAVERVVNLPAWRDAVVDRTTSHSTKPASGQVAGYPAQAGIQTIQDTSATRNQNQDALLINPLDSGSPTPILTFPLKGKERLLPLPQGEGWGEGLRRNDESSKARPSAKGVFFGYDFHLNAEGAHLIEINSNAGGAFLNDLLLQSQREVVMPGEAAALDNLGQVFLEMFRNEWRLECGDAPLNTVAIVDEQPESQYLYPEFLLAQRMFERAGITALVADPSELEARSDGLYCREHKVNLIYNRLTDFFLQRHAALNAAYHNNQVVLTPHPRAYAQYADKRNLARLTDAEELRAHGANEADVAVLQAGIPHTVVVQPDMEAMLWAERKQWFFKPAAGYGSKGTYRGANVTQRVFAGIMQGGYVAQRTALPGGRMVCVEGAEPAPLKSDVRCYVYNGQVQLIAARLYQGQTTNFRTAGGGFAPVRIVG